MEEEERIAVSEKDMVEDRIQKVVVELQKEAAEPVVVADAAAGVVVVVVPFAKTVGLDAKKEVLEVVVPQSVAPPEEPKRAPTIHAVEVQIVTVPRFWEAAGEDADNETLLCFLFKWLVFNVAV